MPDYAAWLARDVVGVEGPEAASYLQGQLTQEVEALGVGATTWSWVLSPQGKVDALVRVCRPGPERYVLDTDAGWGGPLAARLDRFKLRTKVTVEPLEWRVLALRSASADPPPLEPGHVEVVARVSWRGWAGFDLIGPDPRVPEGYRLAGEEECEAARIAAAFPRMGAELDDRTIPAETGLVASTVSFTKGCYTGQELVARIDSRGSNVARHLRLMHPQGRVESGAELTTPSGEPAGKLTSIAALPDGGWIALGYTRRSVEVPVTLVAGGDRTEVMVEPVER